MIPRGQLALGQTGGRGQGVKLDLERKGMQDGWAGEDWVGSDLDVRGRLADDVPWWGVQTDVVLRRGVEDVLAKTDGTSKLRRGLPHHLRKVVVRRVRRVVVSFIQDKLRHSRLHGEVAGAGDEVLAVRAAEQRAARVLDLAVVCPARRRVCERVVPYQVNCVVLRADGVVGVEVAGGEIYE